jgi:hypothetical protein
MMEAKNGDEEEGDEEGEENEEDKGEAISIEDNPKAGTTLETVSPAKRLLVAL